MIHSDELTIRVTLLEQKSKFCHANHKRIIEVSSQDEILFREETTVEGNLYKTRSGIAGAVNLLFQLILNDGEARFLNDDFMLNKKLQSGQKIIAYSADIGKQLRFIPKMRFKLLNFKMKLFNILFN
jgi:hypothetical protein